MDEQEIVKPEPDPLDALLFDSEHHEVIVNVEGTQYPFTVQGLSQFEVEEIGSLATSELTVNPETGAPTARLNQGVFYHHILMRGVVRAPPGFKWNDKNVKRLRGKVRDQLLESIMARSDGMEAFKKKSKTS